MLVAPSSPVHLCPGELVNPTVGPLTRATMRSGRLCNLFRALGNKERESNIIPATGPLGRQNRRSTRGLWRRQWGQRSLLMTAPPVHAVFETAVGSLAVVTERFVAKSYSHGLEPCDSLRVYSVRTSIVSIVVVVL
ncbi:unnamed protein product [Arctogadus glacialis]